MVKIKFGTAVLSAGVVFAACAQSGQAIPDAQVESNVLRALASAPELSTQNIKTQTVYGVVTLTGTASDEASRTKAEQLVARAAGVKKVVDELTLGTGDPVAAAENGSGDSANAANPNSGMVLMSDGTYAPASSAGAQPSAAGAADYGQNGAPQSGNGQQPYVGTQAQTYPAQQTYPTQQSYPAQQPAYDASNAPSSYPQQGGPAYPPRRPMYDGNQGYAPGPVPGGQEGGRVVTVPGGALLRVRINQGLSSNRSQVGSVFDGTVLTDVTADGAVAIPRGAAVQGTVVEAKSAGVLKGRGELALQINTLILGGQRYNLVSDTWQRDGRDKTLRTVNSALGLGVLGALVGGVAGGGAGAAIGAGAGAAAGVGTSAASPGGRVIIPPEYVLNFRLEQPAQVTTVSEQEMSRLSYAAGPGQQAAPRGYYGPQPYYGAGPYPYGR